MKFTKGTLLRISKLALLLVVMGFFMPVSCNQNGFEAADLLADWYGYYHLKIVVLMIFIAAVLSILVSIVLIKKQEKEPLVLDWSLLAVSVGCGIVTVYSLYEDDFSPELQYGAYFIIAGWIISGIFLYMATFSGNSKKQTPDITIETKTNSELNE